MSPQNFLILCSDEHSSTALSCRGHPIIKTPVLDGLAARGTTFTRAYSPSPICVPARACLATGKHVHETRCWSSAEPYHGQLRSWMHMLRDAGRKVVSVGKLHFRSAENDNGFCEEILPMYLANDGKGWPQGLIRDPMPGFEEAAELARDVGPGETSYTNYDRNITNLASEWIQNADKNDPWTLFVSFISPHYPLTAPQEFFDLYKDSEIPEPILDTAIENHPVLSKMREFWDYEDHFDAESRDLGVRGYYGLCSFLDHNIGVVLKALEQSGQMENTTILYISDHGEMLGNHGFWAKSVMYEDSAGIPMILAGPDIPTGTNDTPVNLTDVAATAYDVAGMETSRPLKPWESASLADIAKSPDTDRFILSEYHDGGSPTGFYMIRQGDWKYVYYTGGNPSQLFHLAQDPNELADLSSSPEHSGQLSHMHALLLEILDPEGVNAQAFADQKLVIEANGGKEAILNMPSFNHTPID
ncbi:MAG: sulfatase-like hydrolase/transferase [Pseudomonadota bacterium]